MCRLQSRLARGYPYTTSRRTVQRRHPAMSLSLLSLITRRSFVVTCFERRDVSDEGRRKRTEAPETLRVCHERARCPASEPAAAFSEPQGR